MGILEEFEITLEVMEKKLPKFFEGARDIYRNLETRELSMLQIVALLVDFILNFIDFQQAKMKGKCITISPLKQNLF